MSSRNQNLINLSLFSCSTVQLCQCWLVCVTEHFKIHTWIIYLTIWLLPISLLWFILTLSSKPGVATLFVKGAEKILGGHKNLSKKAWRAKFNLKKSYLIANLTFNSPLSTINSSYHSKCIASFYDFVILYLLLQISK